MLIQQTPFECFHLDVGGACFIAVRIEPFFGRVARSVQAFLVIFTRVREMIIFGEGFTCSV